MEEHLEEMGVSFTPEIVENALKRCFKFGKLAIRFFEWVKHQPRFCHTTEIYNTVIYIACEEGEFGMVEKLMEEMDANLCAKDVKTWTILISGHGKAKKIGKALWAFEEMRRSGCGPDAAAYEAILQALFTARKAELAFEFYKEMVLKKMKVDIKIYSLLMDCLSTAGYIEKARSVGEDMIKIAQLTEAETYSSMLRSFCVSAKVDDACEIFGEMQKKSLCSDLKVYEVFVKGLCRASRMDEAMQVVNDMKPDLDPGGVIYGCLIDGFFRSGQACKALELFSRMRELGCLPKVSSYTQVLQHLFVSGKYSEACELYEEMVQEGVGADVVAITAVVSGHVQNNNISEAWRVFDDMKHGGMRPTRKMYSVFIKELCKTSRETEALRLLNEMSSSKIHVSDYILCLVRNSIARNGEHKKARIVEEEYVCQLAEHQPDLEGHEASSPIDAFDEDEVKELCKILTSSAKGDALNEKLDKTDLVFSPVLVEEAMRRCQRHGRAALQFFSWVGKQPSYCHSSETYNMAIKIAGSGKDFKHMRNLYQEMRRNRCNVTPNTWTIMISQYGQAGLTELALKTFKEMKIEGFKPNGSTFKYMIIFLSGKKGRRMEEAIQIFQEMLPSGYMPDKEMVDIFLSSLCESGRFVEARKAVKSLCKRGFQSQLGYSLLTKSLCRASRVEEALILLGEFGNLGCEVDNRVYANIIHALLREGRLEEALEKVEVMKRAGISTTVHIHTSLIVHFCKEKQIRKAEEIFKLMREEGCQPTVITCSALIRGYMNKGMLLDAWNTFYTMKFKGPSPDFRTYSMFMNCLCKEGKSADALKLIHDMLENQIIPSAINFRTVYYGLNREGKQELAQHVLEIKSNLKKERMISYSSQFI
ncbi:hypothetical protein HPP92_016090 [Vanilla planifolia]|uniref:Pentatricopeptide repeat-containing protein n=1 Tax=Vanilla planifolia TaxID=51239 RepID=A0A835UUA8_VANPL|nr:hypothetical protein HPP92_016090 [Vanilla planifolia]